MKIGDLVKEHNKIGVVMDIIDGNTIHIQWPDWPAGHVEETAMYMVEYVDSLF